MTRGTVREKRWTAGFMVGSFCQGAILRGVVQGVKVVDGVFAGSAFDWLNPFSLVCGLAVMCGLCCTTKPDSVGGVFSSIKPVISACCYGYFATNYFGVHNLLLSCVP